MTAAAPKWFESRQPFWFVCTERGAPWASTARMTRRNSIAAWLRGDKHDWQWWYRRGYRCKQLRIRFAVVRP